MRRIYKTSLLISSIFTIHNTVLAQNEMDAYRYSNTFLTGTARSLGVGGAMGAVGGDMSAVSINPASIGVYRRSEMVFTPVLKFNNVNSTYLNQDNNVTSTKFAVNNFGFIFTNVNGNNKKNTSGWQSANFGVTFNKLADFNTKGMYSGINSESSITEIFAADAKAAGVEDNMIPPFGFLGYEGFLMDNNYNSYAYNNIIKQGGSVYQDKVWNQKGSVQEWSFSVGGNYADKLYLGGSMNLQSYRLERNTSYLEEDNTGNKNNNFAWMQYDEYLYTRGTGVNFKVGALYQISPEFRIGAHIQTPTWSSFNDESDYKMTSETEGARVANGSSGTRSEVQPNQISMYEYNMRTPWKFGINAMAFLGDKGFVSFDYEMIDYTSMNYTFQDADYKYENIVNTAIAKTFKPSHNVRLGVEGRMKNVYGRLGGGFSTSAFQQNDLFEGSRMHFALGTGVNFQGFSVNLSYTQVFQPTKEYAYPMTPQGIPVGLASVKNNYGLLALSLVFKY
jgi:hypothetical protein